MVACADSDLAVQSESALRPPPPSFFFVHYMYPLLEGIVIPLHKGGDKCDISNYRVITLGSHVGKLFCSARLSEVMEQSILKEAQGGFRKNRRTTDKLFVVNGIGQLRRSQGKKTCISPPAKVGKRL